MTGIESPIKISVSVELQNERLDKALSSILEHITRSSIQEWIKNGDVLVNQKIQRSNYKLRLADLIFINVPAPNKTENQPQRIDLDIIHEDGEILIINKPTGLVVHPGAGNSEGTLLNGLLYHHTALKKLPRAGIVHRLDKGTSGLMAIAKTEPARQNLIVQINSREMQRQYLAIVEGNMIAGCTVNQPIGRHFSNRLRMSVTEKGKPATTHFRVKRKYVCHTLVHAKLETGRTHQIRVHLSWLGYPLIGDRLYGFKARTSGINDMTLVKRIREFQRPALHAEGLSLTHPGKNTRLSWKQPLPEDFAALDQHLSKTRPNR